MWKQIIPGVFSGTPDRSQTDQTRLQELQAGGSATRAEYLNTLRDWNARQRPHSMQEAGAAFLLELEQGP